MWQYRSFHLGVASAVSSFLAFSLRTSLGLVPGLAIASFAAITLPIVASAHSHHLFHHHRLDLFTESFGKSGHLRIIRVDLDVEIETHDGFLRHAPVAFLIPLSFLVPFILLVPRVIAFQLVMEHFNRREDLFEGLFHPSVPILQSAHEIVAEFLGTFLPSHLDFVNGFMHPFELMMESFHLPEDVIEGAVNLLVSSRHVLAELVTHPLGVFPEVVHAFLDAITNHVRHLFETFVHEAMHVIHHALFTVIHPALEFLFHRSMIVTLMVVGGDRARRDDEVIVPCLFLRAP